MPLPDLEERLPILQVHCKGKRMATDVDLGVVARGTPGMSGADLANLVNEAALHAVRRGSLEIAMADFETARDRVLLGQRRESMVLSEAEKERIAYHEGGHAVLAYVLEHADPVHKVTILPTGMALGVTHQLPMEERHIHPRQYIEDSLCVRMGGRCAELLVYGDLSTGAANDLVGNTELARKMVREWGMSDAIGPMAWGSQGQVFLGEDLMHTRDYSEDTSKIIDDEVERILRVRGAAGHGGAEQAPRRAQRHRPGAARQRDHRRRRGGPAGRRGPRVARARRGRQVGAALQRGRHHRAGRQRRQRRRQRARAARRRRRRRRADAAGGAVAVAGRTRHAGPEPVAVPAPPSAGPPDPGRPGRRRPGRRRPTRSDPPPARHRAHRNRTDPGGAAS